MIFYYIAGALLLKLSIFMILLKVDIKFFRDIRTWIEKNVLEGRDLFDKKEDYATFVTFLRWPALIVALSIVVPVTTVFHDLMLGLILTGTFIFIGILQNHLKKTAPKEDDTDLQQRPETAS